jgi:peptidyl-tRNA hydrolase
MISSEGLNTIKAKAIINRNAQTIFRVIGDAKYKKLFDPVYDYDQFIERIADQTFLVYYKTKAVFVVGPRDFVLVLHANQTPDGVIYAIVQDAGRNDLRPETKGIVRGYLPMGAWKLSPLPEDKNKTLCEYIAEIDLKGNMPAFIMKTAIKDQGYQICKLRKAVEVYLKDHNLL